MPLDPISEAAAYLDAKDAPIVQPDLTVWLNCYAWHHHLYVSPPAVALLVRLARREAADPRGCPICWEDELDRRCGECAMADALIMAEAA